MFPLLPDGVRDVIHDWPLSKTWAEMEGLVKKGKVRSIGVSNCSELKLNEIMANATIVPAVNQIELHAYNPQKKLLKFMKEKGIVAQAYSPLGSTNSPLLKDEVVVSIAQKKGVEPGAVLLAYLGELSMPTIYISATQWTGDMSMTNSSTSCERHCHPSEICHAVSYYRKS